MQVITLIAFAASCPVLAAAVHSADADEPNPDSLKASEVLDRMASAYAHCKSYRDTGVAKTVFIRAAGKHTVEKPFSTAFVRPDRFRFEYKEKPEKLSEMRYIVWRKGQDVATWWDVKPGVEKSKSLGLALAGATGVSSGSAHTVPGLLMKDEVGGRLLTAIEEVKRIEDAKLDKVNCIRVEGKFADRPMTIWIDKKTFLVRRIDSQSKFDDFRTEETTTYEPVIDSEIPEKELEFNPPKQK